MDQRNKRDTLDQQREANHVDSADQLDQFEAHRRQMFAIAYRMLGSASDAEDVLQEAYLRYRAVPPESIVSPQAFLTRMVTRLCLNQLQSARAQRETYLGPWLPEPLVTDEADPEALVDQEESISMAFLVLLQRLSPVERAVFLLHEVFEYSYAEIAQIVGKEEAACRQIFSRAKKSLMANRPRFTPSDTEHQLILERFLAAVEGGDLDGLIGFLSEEITLWADGGGRVRGAATQPVHGRMSVARFILGSLRFIQEPYATEITEVNGEPAVIIRVQGAPFIVICFGFADDGIRDLWVVGNPDKLHHIQPASS